MKRTTVTMIVLTCLTLMSASAAYAAEVAVIVNSGNSNELGRGTVEKIYSGDMNMWPGGGAVAAFDLPEDSPSRAALASGLLGKSTSSVKALWAAKLFSGRATPPKVLASDDEVKRAVAANKNAIGYISAANVDGSVKVVLTIR